MGVGKSFDGSFLLEKDFFWKKTLNCFEFTSDVVKEGMMKYRFEIIVMEVIFSIVCII